MDTSRAVILAHCLLAGLVLMADAGCPSPASPRLPVIQPASQPASRPGSRPTRVKVRPAPATIRMRGEQVSKPPSRTFLVDLTLTNRQAHETWFLIQYSASEALSRSGRFSTVGSFPVPLEGKQWSEGAARAVLIQCYGTPSFKALRLPPRSTLHLRRYDVDSRGELTQLEVFEASALLVNGRTPLERWLPYKTLSAPGRVDCSRDWKNLAWDHKRNVNRTDYPKEKINFVQARVTGRWTVPVVR